MTDLDPVVQTIADALHECDEKWCARRHLVIGQAREVADALRAKGHLTAPGEVSVPREVLPSCSCGGRHLYAENPPRLGPHHNASCDRYRDRRGRNPASVGEDR